MTLEEAKQEYPPGTVFYPAHLYDTKDNLQDKQYHLTIPLDATYEVYTKHNDIIIHSKTESFTWNPNIYYNGKKAPIISKPIVKSEQELLLEQADRDYPIGTTFYAAHTSNNSSRTKCIREKNDKIIFKGSNIIALSKNGLDYKTNSFGLFSVIKHGPDNWATKVEQENSKKETLLEKAERLYPVGTTFNIAHSSSKFHCKRVEGESFREDSVGNIVISNGNNRKNGHGMSEVVYYKLMDKWADIISFESPLGKNSVSTREEKNILPEQWIITITEETLPYVNAYRATQREYNTPFKKEGTGKYTYSYINEYGVGKKASNIGNREFITLEQFKQFLTNKGIKLPNSVDFDSSPGANYSNSDYIQTLYTPKKSRIPEVELLQVKKRPII